VFASHHEFKSGGEGIDIACTSSMLVTFSGTLTRITEVCICDHIVATLDHVHTDKCVMAFARQDCAAGIRMLGRGSE
jgi:hypothetical protein